MKRVLVFVLLALVLALPVFGGGAKETEPTAAAAVPDTGREAPMLAEKVARGELPPVEARLPVNPVVVVPHEEIGKYGGTWRNFTMSVTMSDPARFHTRYVRLVAQEWDQSGFKPDLAEQWTISSDNRVYTFNLREGVKWSDGHPLTADDFVFWYEAVIMNRDLTPVPPAFMRVGGEVGRIEKVSDYVVRFVFPEPHPLFLYYQSLVSYAVQDAMFEHPKHYMSQFHPDYASKEDLDRRISDAGAASWVMLFEQKREWWLNPEVPGLQPWVLEQAPDVQGRSVFVRNPYFFRVDPEGNQLPYIDRVQYNLYGDLEVAVLETIAGNIDYHTLYYRASNYPVLKQNEQAGNYRVIPLESYKGGELSVFLNQTTNDPVLRELFQDLRFRKAVSLAMNRQEVIDVQFFGLAVPRQASPPPYDPVYSAEWSNSFIEYDPAGANALLDGIGLNRRDSQGYRLRPDGRRLNILFEYSVHRGWDRAYELIAEYLEDVGIEVSLRGRDRSAFLERWQTNEAQMTSWSTVPQLDQLGSYLPGPWGRGWQAWNNTSGAEGIEPPAPVKRIFELHNRAFSVQSFDEYVDIVKEMGDIHAENLYMIGIMGNDVRPAVVTNRFGNVRTNEDGIAYQGPIATPSATNSPELFYFK